MTTARALRGPFDYRLPEELRGRRGRRRLDARRARSAAARCSAWSSASPTAARSPRRSCSRRCARSSSACPPSSSRSPTGSPREYCSTIARALALVLPPGAARRLSGRRRRGSRAARTHLPVGARRPQPPQLDRRAAAPRSGRCSRRSAARRVERRLLHGVTGSGKTEVYLRAAAAALEQGRGAIVLVPEIALTPQIVARFVERFGDTVAVLHSRLTPGAALRRVAAPARGRGAGLRRARARPCSRRSTDLGLIVVDEEHDASYKHEGDPRYDAREVAAERARRAAARCCSLGQRDAAPGERAGHASLRARGARRRAAAAAVEVLDMRGERSGLHPRDRAGARRGARAGRQGDRAAQPPRLVELPLLPLLRARLELPGLRRRARAAPRRGLPRLPPLRPPRAGSRALRRLRLDVGRPPRRRHRAPRSTSSPQLLDDGGLPRLPPRRRRARRGGGPRGGCRGRPGGDDGGVAALLRRFEAAERGVLIGTQMVAKGHDFPDVTLGVVLDADATLRFPDFRAEERTFALIAQLAGRVGRGERRAGARADDRPRGARDRARRPATTATASSPASSSAGGRSATRRSRT